LNINKLNSIYFLGIGGIGMSALAKYFHAIGVTVSGYDKTPSITTKQLEELNIPICYNEELEHIMQPFDLVVYTPAIPAEHKQFQYFKSNGFEIMKRAQVLGLITNNSTQIAVAGTHGKTTTSSIIAHIFSEAQSNFMAILGGIAKNYNSNFFGKPNAHISVLEADEYDRSFLNLYPKIAVITAMDADHLDIYGAKENMIDSYNQFAKQIDINGHLFIQNDYINDLKNWNEQVSTYGLTKDCNYYATNIKVQNGIYVFDFFHNNNCLIQNLSLAIGGRHNLENTVVAIAIALKLEIDVEIIKKALNSYKGVLRRFDIRFKHEKIVYIDDYAHHPNELTAFISAVKEMYPEKNITAVFQPHLYSRTRDFYVEFAKALDLLDDVILLDIYPARELPLEGISSEMILSRMKLDNKMICKKSDVIEELVKRNADIILTIGAGDIDTLVLPIEKTFKNIADII